MFTKVPGGAELIDTGHVRVFVREAAEHLRLATADFGGASPRIGGATDLYDVYGPAGEKLINEKGRWCSEVAQIYRRASSDAHVQASVDMEAAVGYEEEALTRHAQPALR